MPETAENCGGKVEEIVCEDRISALPDDLLVKILADIPTREAVSTLILSKQWRFFWTMLPTLVYKEDDEDDENNKKSVWWFLDQSLELHKAPLLETLCINLGPGCPTNANVSKWVEKAVDRGVRVLFFKLCWSAGPTILPNCLYTCKTLTHLRLSRKILVDFPSSSCLPSLIALDLYYVVYKDEASLVRFLSSCPLLHVLAVKRKKEDNVAKFSVKVPSLVFLAYENKQKKDHNDVVDTGRSLVMDTPKLTDFDITDYSGDSCLIENMPHLNFVCIMGEHFHDIDSLLRPISAVSSLELNMTDKMVVCCSTIIFSRLTKCEISLCDSDCMDSLVLLLQSTPVLKSLIITYGFSSGDPSSSWKESSSNPICLSSTLEKFELIDYLESKEEEEMIYYILGNSKSLKTATISLKTKLYFDQDEETVIEKLKAIPRFSISSQLLIEIHGKGVRNMFSI